jgi:hypothetical protein
LSKKKKKNGCVDVLREHVLYRGFGQFECGGSCFDAGGFIYFCQDIITFKGYYKMTFSTG